MSGVGRSSTGPRLGRHAVALVGVLVVLATPPPVAAASLASRLASLVRGSGLASSTSVSVATTSGTTIYRWKSAMSRTPASNEKLLTEVTALDVLGPDHRFATVVRAEAPSHGVIAGAITLVGSGDPTLTGRRLRLLARAVRAAGVTAVDGGVIADGSLFDGLRGVPAWKAGFSPQECSPLSALVIDRGVAAGKPVWSPELRAARLFRTALRAAGIAVRGPARVGTAPAGAATLATSRSARLVRILPRLGKNSDNFTAEILLKDVAAARRGLGTTAGGVSEVRAMLARRGVLTSSVTPVDGSGLASGNHVTTDVLVRLLVSALADSRIGPGLDASLAVAGIDGTLQHRMLTGPARGKVHAKTGTLNQVSALSGRTGQYVFSIISSTSRPYLAIAQAQALQDGIAQLLARRAAAGQ